MIYSFTIVFEKLTLLQSISLVFLFFKEQPIIRAKLNLPDSIIFLKKGHQN